MSNTTSATRTRRVSAAEQVAQLTEQNQRLQAQLNLLASAAMPQGEAPEREPELRQRLWLNDRYTAGFTRTSGNSFVRFTAQKSSRRQDNSRIYGEYRNFVAYGEMTAHVLEILSGQDRLVDIEAWESPYLDGSRKSRWVITAITPVERTEPAAPMQPALPPFSGEPTDEEFPF